MNHFECQPLSDNHQTGHSCYSTPDTGSDPITHTYVDHSVVTVYLQNGYSVQETDTEFLRVKMNDFLYVDMCH